MSKRIAYLVGMLGFAVIGVFGGSVLCGWGSFFCFFAFIDCD